MIAPAAVWFTAMLGCLSQRGDGPTRTVMNRKDVNYVCGDNPVDDAIRSKYDLANRCIGKLRDRVAQVRKVSQWIDRTDQATNHDLCVGRGIRFDERVDRREVNLRAFGPVESIHARKRFLISSWLTT